MKIVVDSSILIKAYREFSEPHRDFLDSIRLLNKRSRKCLVYLCINAEVLNDYEQSLRGLDLPPYLEEAFHAWYRSIVNFGWQNGGSLDETEKEQLECKHPVEHALIAFAYENDKKIVATKEINGFGQARCFFNKTGVIGYLINKGVSVIDAGEATEWIWDNVTFISNETEKVDLVNLSKQMKRAFNKDELRVLCFELSVDFDNLSASDKQNTIINIISHFDRRGNLNDLLEHLRKVRNDVQW